jgi:hypothetical protein
MEIDGIQFRSLADSEKRFSALIWGPAGCGKTVFACSAGGRKLLINFDPDGPSSLGAREDVFLIDLSDKGKAVVNLFKLDDDPLLPVGDKSYRLSKIIETFDISTVIVDSVSAFSQLSTEMAITQIKGATVENPSPGGYGARNIYTLRMLNGILRTTKKLERNCIFITHEDDSGVRDKEGNLLHITMILGGKLTSSAALQISEVWHMNDDGKKRRIMVRPGRQRKPMKTRMFNATDRVEFDLKYDQAGKEAPYGEHSLASFIEEWKANGFNKIAVPN